MIAAESSAVIATVLTGAILAGGGLYLRAYLSKKAENLATREDVRDLTRRVEQVRADFVAEQERDRHHLARRLEEHRLSLSAELEIYRDLWDRLLILDNALMNIHVAYGIAESDASVTQRRREASAAFSFARDDIIFQLRRVKPFVAPEVHNELFRAMLVIRKISAETQVAESGGGAVAGQMISDGISQTAIALQSLSDVIRRRLYPGDATPIIGDATHVVATVRPNTR